MKLHPELYIRYCQGNLSDVDIRIAMMVPDRKYYIISRYPESVAGSFRIERDRVPPVGKISKSNQP